MRKTSVYLEEAQVEQLRWLAQREGRPQAQILREAILLYAERAGRKDRHFAMDGIAEGPGGSVAHILEDELLNGFGEDSLGIGYTSPEPPK